MSFNPNMPITSFNHPLCDHCDNGVESAPCSCFDWPTPEDDALRIAALEGEIRGIRCFTTPDGAQYDLTDINYVLDLIHKAECSELNQTHAERAERELAEKQARLLNVAKGCHDYGGGYRGGKVFAEVYHHGIQTVINALESAIREPDSTQVRALERAAIDVARRSNE